MVGEARPSYFGPLEFLCRCGRLTCDAQRTIAPDLLTRLNQLRHALGHPVIIRSGLRCTFWNARQGGVPESEHLTGHGVDVATDSSAERDALLTVVYQEGLFPRKGIGRTFLQPGHRAS